LDECGGWGVGDRYSDRRDVDDVHGDLDGPESLMIFWEAFRGSLLPKVPHYFV
jgi:hypothetical protein